MKKNKITIYFLLIFFALASFLVFPIFLKKKESVVRSPLSKTGLSPVSPIPTPTSRITKLAFAGEMIFARTVASKILQYKDYKHPFYKVKPILDQADFRFATLEAPLSGKNIPCPPDYRVFVADKDNVEGLKYANINMVSLANNHFMDGGNKGLTETLKNLDEVGIGHVGAGLTLDEARKPQIKEINGLKIGFLAYNNIPPVEYAAAIDKPGTAWAKDDYLIEDIKKLKEKVDFLILSFHWGVEYTAKPHEEQIRLAHLAIDEGADLIIGDHPHWVQSLEFYKDKLIVYGIGNFVLDQMFSEETKQGLILLITLENKNLKKIEIFPFKIFDYVQPIPMEGEEKEQMINYIFSITDEKSRDKLRLYLNNK